MELLTFIREALREDIGPGDYSSLSTIPESATGQARLLVKENGILAGIRVAEIIAAETGLKIELFLKDGAIVKSGDVAFILSGKTQSILQAERLLLNCMQRMSGIATITSRYVKAVEGYPVKILDTRKTTPLMRALEKEAVGLGGGKNHRMGLYDMVMIKDNHVDAAGGITNALQRAKEYLLRNNLSLKIEIETRNVDEVREALTSGIANRIMLDNFNPDLLKEAVILINKRAETEASGGITLDNILSYAATGVDYISVGALTHSVKSLDLSLKIV
jgi:nicotinate-nucleotide pyrophosphorylase (carboxylating)